jgi:hypothetical protein
MGLEPRCTKQESTGITLVSFWRVQEYGGKMGWQLTFAIIQYMNNFDQSNLVHQNKLHNTLYSCTKAEG